MKTMTIALMCLLLAGCQVARHEARIETFDPNGLPTGSYRVILDRQMMMKTTKDGVTVEADSRDVGEGILEGIMKIITLGLIVD